MATYTSDQGVEYEPSAEDINTMMVAKAHELFSLCDLEEKGFITKRDMQRLKDELPLTPDQLENVFDSLDDDGNGFLTLEEFTDGFGSFLGLTPVMSKQDSTASQGSNEMVYENEHLDAENEESFNELIDQIGAQGIFDDVDVIRGLYGRLRNDEPELVTGFEDFLVKVTGEIKRHHSDFKSLESALRSKSSAHDEEVRKLYEEMEQQIKLEKERIIAEEKARERQLREEMDREILEKDRKLKELERKHHDMESQLQGLNVQDTDIKMENEKLTKEKQDLEEMLRLSQAHLEDSKSYINELKGKQREDKRDRAMAALQISEGIALERESLVKQLDMLREMNRKLRDERDEADLKRREASLQQELEFGDRAAGLYNGSDSVDNNNDTSTDKPDGQNEADEATEAPKSPEMDEAALRRQVMSKTRQGSLLSNYFDSSRLSTHQMSIESDCEEEYEVESSLNNSSMTMEQFCSSLQERQEKDRRSGTLPRATSSESEFDIHGARPGPIGENRASEHIEKYTNEEIASKSPERVFKVVFVGDSGVGKSSFIHRFCNSEFKSTFSATIGVDFQVKNMLVEDHIIALQLWDTAGQERFRSITKQYFRKADGVLIMYDVTSETSYKNVRNWMVSVQDGTEDSTVLAVVGNKMDLVEDEDTRPVKSKDGVRLADDYGALFYETSAKSNLNVYETLHGMASLLREREDEELEKALNLSDEVEKKKGCCN